MKSEACLDLHDVSGSDKRKNKSNKSNKSPGGFQNNEAIMESKKRMGFPLSFTSGEPIPALVSLLSPARSAQKVPHQSEKNHHS